MRGDAYDSDFRAYCRTLTDRQLANVIDKEREGASRDPDREGCLTAALVEREARERRR
jgi:hypothetical protein